LLDALNLYKAENEDKDFAMMHCFQKLEGCKEWDRVRLTLNDGKTGEKGPLPAAPTAPRCPTGTKKAKSERNVGSFVAGFDVSINLFVDSMSPNTKELYDRSDARWKEIKEAQREKLALERERVQAAKLGAEATLIKAKSDTKSFELTKMVEEAKILLMPLEGMDPLTKSWYIMIRDRIDKELMSAHELPVVQPKV
jgi:hypothetical protein